jgi:hypothetical protein
MTAEQKSVLIKVKELPPSLAFRAWIRKHIPKGVKILFTTDS